MTSQNRVPRDEDTREVFTRPESWSPPELLPAPKKEPGWEYRYIRAAVNGEDDPMNMNRARREGWEPVQASEQPHLVVFNDKGSKSGIIEIGGLVLCKAPTEFVQQRNAYYKAQSQNAQKSVDNTLMREQDARMPLFRESKTKVSFGNGG